MFRTRDWLRWLAVVAGAVLAVAVGHAVGAGLALDPRAAYALGFVAVCGSALAAAVCCPPFGPRALWLLAAPAGVLGWLALDPPGELAVALLVTAALLLGGVLLGAVVGRAIEDPGHLLFVAIVSSAADLLSVFHPSGPSHAIARSEAALSVLALPWPMLGTARIEAFLGVGDVVFVSLYVACTRRHGLSLPRTLLALSLGFALAMAAVLDVEQAVPALPLLGAAMLLVQPRARRPPPADRARGFLIAGLIAAACAASLLFR